MNHQVDFLDLDPSAAREHIVQLVEDWRGALEGDKLVLPSQSGLRRGIVHANLTIERLGVNGCRVELEPTGAEMVVHLPSVLVLLAGAISGLGLMIWPFVPRLTPMMPVAFLLAIAAWFLVASRLGQLGLTEFAEALERLGTEQPAPDAKADPE